MPQEHLYINKEKGNTKDYKFTEIGAKFFLELLAYKILLKQLNFPNLFQYLGTDEHTFHNLIKTSSRIIVIEAASFNLLQGIIVFFSEESLRYFQNQAFIKNGSGLFIKFSLQGKENSELQRMSDCCFTGNPNLSNPQKHISNMFMNTQNHSFDFECGYILMPYTGLRDNPNDPDNPEIVKKHFMTQVRYSVNLPLATFNFDFNKMRLMNESSEFLMCLEPFNRNQKGCQFVSISPLAPGTTFIDSLNEFENEHAEFFSNPVVKHRIANMLKFSTEHLLETETKLYLDYRDIVFRQLSLGFAIGSFHQRCAVPDPKNPILFKIPSHMDFHLRNFHIYKTEDFYQVSIIDNSDFAKAFDPQGYLIPQNTKPLGYDLFYLLFKPLHKTGALHIGGYINAAQKRARGEEVISATDFIDLVGYYFFIGYLQAWPQSYPSLLNMFTAHNWVTAPIVFARYHISLTPNKRDFELLKTKLEEAYAFTLSLPPRTIADLLEPNDG